MIGSFWNLCRACPSMPVDKLHSEYRSTYRWHEYTGPRQEIVRRAPQPATGTGYNAPSLRPTRSAEEATTESNTGERAEPALPRRKKHPELAYRAHEFLARSETAGSNDSLDSVVPVADRARSEERVPARPRPSRRSKSEGPPQSEYRLQYMKFRGDEDQDMIIKAYQNAPGGNSLSSALSRISTEYRLQFAWPPNSRINMESGPPPKSLSMGAIRPPGISSGHKKHTAEGQGEEGASELEPLVGLETTDGPTSIEIDELLWDEKFQEEILSKEDTPQHRKEINTEYKKKFQPFSQYDYIEGKFTRKKEEEVIPVPLLLPNMQQNDTWYKEVLELRKKAGEYKHRGWGTELVPEHIAELYNKQMTLWEQVSRRSSLSALSLATTTHRSISKEEKDKQNTKKSSPTNPVSSNTINLKTVPIREKLLDSEKRKVEKPEETKKEYPRSRKDYLVRHHLDRTTGATDGSVLQSPTREKLEPVIPVQKDENYQTKSPQKSSPKNSPRSDNQSPKRQTRGTGALAAVHKSHMNGPVQAERRPRPTSLTTTAPSRGKSSLVSLKSDGSAVHPVNKAKTSSSKLPAGVAQSAKSGDERNQLSEGKDSSTEDQILDEVNLPSSCFSEKDENEPTVVKSPPEPTRVKSPEQILMKSPEPVNWTVPLDTGKTFTVTQNVHKAGLINRPHSELKAWTPPAEPPPAPQSAPPELLQQLPQSSSEWIHFNTKESVAADVGSEYPGQHSKEEQPASYLTSPKSVTMHEEPTDQKVKEDQGATFATKESTSPCEPSHTVQEHVPPESSQVKVLPAISPSSGQSLAADVLEKARTRFDKFWRKNKESPTE